MGPQPALCPLPPALPILLNDAGRPCRMADPGACLPWPLGVDRVQEQGAALAQPALAGIDGGVDAVAQVELAQNVLDVDFDRGLGDAQRARDVLVAVALGDEF